MMGAASKSTSMEYVPSAPESSKVPIAPMGKCLVDMSISILIFNDVGAASIYQTGVRAIVRLKLQKFLSPRWEDG